MITLKLHEVAHEQAQLGKANPMVFVSWHAVLQLGLLCDGHVEENGIVC